MSETTAIPDVTSTGVQADGKPGQETFEVPADFTGTDAPDASTVSESSPAPPSNTLEGIASDWGWRPGGKKSAAEYVRDERVIQAKLHKDLDQIRQDTQAYKDHMQRLLEAERTRQDGEADRLEADYELRRRQAVEAGDYEALTQIEDEWDEVEEQLYEQEERLDGADSTADQPTDAFTAWQQERAPWWEQDPVRMGIANAVAGPLMQAERPAEEIYAAIDQAVQHLGPWTPSSENGAASDHHSSQQPRNEQGQFTANAVPDEATASPALPAVEGALRGQAPRGRAKANLGELPEDMQRQAKAWVEAGLYKNTDQVLDEWIKVGAIQVTP